MGCGQSKIHLYPRKSKSKANGKKGGHGDSDAETDEDEAHIEDSEKYHNRERDRTDETEEQNNKDSTETDEEVSVSLLRAKNLSLLQSQEISTSQQNFFRMLDKKIEEGPDYDSASETEIALEEARLNALVQHWESASLTASICSSASRSLQTTPVRQSSGKQLATPRGMLPTAIPPQVLNSEFLPHGNPQSGQLAAGPLKLSQNKQLITIPHMNSSVLHQMAVVPPIPISMTPETAATTVATAPVNTSSALALLQAPPQQTQQYLFTIPATSSQLLTKTNPVSPKRLADGRLLMNPSPLAQPMQPPVQQTQLQNQFIPATPNPQATPATSMSIVNGNRSPQPALSMQMAYFGHPSTAQQSMQAALQQQHQQQQQQQQQQQHNEQTPQSQSQSYYGDVMQTVQAPTEYRFPPVISVQRLAPQVQRQLRETQELIKDSCPQLYAAGYGSPGPPPMRNQAARNHPNRRPTLETQFSQELS